MFMPWREVDIRFDDEGAHVRFDWQYDDSHRLDRLPSGFFTRRKKKVFKDVGYGIFRLDALPDNNKKPPDEEQEKHRADSTYQAMTYSSNIMSVMTLRMDSCVSTSEEPAKAFTCILEQRPMSASESSLYLEPPYGKTGEGSWFTFLGTVGRLQLSFEMVPDGEGNYEATPVTSWCGGFSPCPFVVHEPFKAQFSNNVIVLEQSDPGLKPAKRAVFHFYPLFKDAALQVTNQNGFTDHGSEPPKIIPT